MYVGVGGGGGGGDAQTTVLIHNLSVSHPGPASPHHCSVVHESLPCVWFSQRKDLHLERDNVKGGIVCLFTKTFMHVCGEAERLY